VKYPLFLSDFPDTFSKNCQVSHFTELGPVRTELRADRRVEGRTDRHDEAADRLSQF
jgi:hypothetical protein